jgi:hypothetical protein
MVSCHNTRWIVTTRIKLNIMKKVMIISCIMVLIVVGCRKEISNEPELAGVSYLSNSRIFYCVDCFPTFNASINGFVIKDMDSYKRLGDTLNIRTYNPLTQINCDTATLIPIDFDKYTLIGIFTSYGVCDIVKRNIQADALKQNILYNITIKKHNGFCVDILATSLNFALIPKLHENWNVLFTLKTE